jgi:hypothetical protein
VQQDHKVLLVVQVHRERQVVRELPVLLVYREFKADKAQLVQLDLQELKEQQDYRVQQVLPEEQAQLVLREQLVLLVPQERKVLLVQLEELVLKGYRVSKDVKEQLGQPGLKVQ